MRRRKQKKANETSSKRYGSVLEDEAAPEKVVETIVDVPLLEKGRGLQNTVLQQKSGIDADMVNPDSGLLEHEEDLRDGGHDHDDVDVDDDSDEIDKALSISLSSSVLAFANEGSGSSPEDGVISENARIMLACNPDIPKPKRFKLLLTPKKLRQKGKPVLSTKFRSPAASTTSNDSEPFDDVRSEASGVTSSDVMMTSAEVTPVATSAFPLFTDVLSESLETISLNSSNDSIATSAAESAKSKKGRFKPRKLRKKLMKLKGSMEDIREDNNKLSVRRRSLSTGCLNEHPGEESPTPSPKPRHKALRGMIKKVRNKSRDRLDQIVHQVDDQYQAIRSNNGLQ